jgi:hypothetical protein
LTGIGVARNVVLISTSHLPEREIVMSTYIAITLGGIIGNIIWNVVNAPARSRRPVGRR